MSKLIEELNSQEMKTILGGPDQDQSSGGDDDDDTSSST